METQTTNAPPALYMSERGEIACLPHAPYRGSDSWNVERWERITREEADEFEREVGHAPSCETCNAERRNR